MGHDHGYFFSFLFLPLEGGQVLQQVSQVLLLIDFIIIISHGSSCVVTPDSSSIVLCV